MDPESNSSKATPEASHACLRQGNLSYCNMLGFAFSAGAMIGISLLFFMAISIFIGFGFY